MIEKSFGHAKHKLAKAFNIFLKTPPAKLFLYRIDGENFYDVDALVFVLGEFGVEPPTDEWDSR